MATLPGLSLNYREEYETDDQKGYGAHAGNACIGILVWFGPTNPIVTEEGFGSGWYSWPFEPADEAPAGPFLTLEDAARALEAALSRVSTEVA